MKLLEFAKIVLLCVAASVVYGILHDMVTAHVAVKYFTKYHATVVDSQSPIVMALVWGMIATWWMGAFLGTLLGLAAQTGSPPFLYWRRLLGPVVKLLIVMAFCAAIAACVGLLEAFENVDPFAEEPANERMRLTAVWYAHNASYIVGFFGGLWLVAWTLWKRPRLSPDGP